MIMIVNVSVVAAVNVGRINVPVRHQSVARLVVKILPVVVQGTVRANAVKIKAINIVQMMNMQMVNAASQIIWATVLKSKYAM